MLSFLCLCVGFALGYFIKGMVQQSTPQKQTEIHYNAKESVRQTLNRPNTHLQRLYLKSMHASDSDRIRELNLLSKNQSSFLRLLQQIFHEYRIAIKQQRFIVLDRDQFPIAIFEYRDGTQALKLIDQEDGLPLHLYKGLISSEALKEDYLRLISQQNTGKNPEI